MVRVGGVDASRVKMSRLLPPQPVALHVAQLTGTGPPLKPTCQPRFAAAKVTHAPTSFVTLKETFPVEPAGSAGDVTLVVSVRPLATLGRTGLAVPAQMPPVESSVHAEDSR